MIMSAVVGLSILGGGTALAGNTSKQVYFGSGPFPGTLVQPHPENYSLSFTPVSAGRVTSAYLTIQNKGGGTLNHVILEGGNTRRARRQTPASSRTDRTQPADLHGNQPETCLRSLPAGFTYVAAFRLAGGPCTIYDASGAPATTGPGIKCDVGQLSNNATAKYRFAIQAPAGASNDYQAWFTASGNEGTSIWARTRTPSSPWALFMSIRRPRARMRNSSRPVPWTPVFRPVTSRPS